MLFKKIDWKGDQDSRVGRPWTLQLSQAHQNHSNLQSDYLQEQPED